MLSVALLEHHFHLIRLCPMSATQQCREEGLNLTKYLIYKKPVKSLMLVAALANSPSFLPTLLGLTARW